ncbi:peroxidase 27-like [Amaranthus tricolor]|uniref:peroxidase 27-like n=1 Tax=Amaranthus tricolor TaxID=29722 RepID=UPI002589800A|nr:peroxidase 27-like [Amaranthus tricolor]XP_057517017.1 peroxidase 27-like [Amaranthus tricolor]XP_057517021.1 peroxidase 27-like [Amaranthus tricolor]XP_057517656.1 peroxidase 27-like [Amaranthus tricolor]
MTTKIFQKLFSFFLLLAMISAMANAEELSLDYYKYSCPGVEDIAKRITEQYISNVPGFAPGLLRMVFHDCFVRGCDASVLIDPTESNNQTEKTALPNVTLRGYEVINAIKSALEKQCPGVVSCADILALSSRDAIRTINGPFWEVPLGRKDGKISLASDADTLLPSPFFNFSSLKENFASLGLTTKDLVVLLGSHTIGQGHCFVFQSRLYNFSGRGDTDPSLSPSYAAFLKTKCTPNPNDTQSVVPLDRITPRVFDENYYVMVSQNKGLFHSDAALLTNAETKSYIYQQIKTKRSTFAQDFSASMSKMIKLGVLTGNQGEVRKTCGVVNA